MIFVTILLYAITIELGMDLNAMYVNLGEVEQVLVFMAAGMMLWGDIRRVFT